MKKSMFLIVVILLLVVLTLGCHERPDFDDVEERYSYKVVYGIYFCYANDYELSGGALILYDAYIDHQGWMHVDVFMFTPDTPVHLISLENDK